MSKAMNIMPISVLLTIYYIIYYHIFSILSTELSLIYNFDKFSFLGEFAQILFILSFAYIFVTFIYKYREKIIKLLTLVLIKNKLTESINEKTINKKYKIIFKTIRKPLLYFHGTINIIGTIAGGLHGLSYIKSSDSYMVSTGILIFLIMVLISSGGILILFNLGGKYHFRGIKRFARITHKRWIYTILLVVVLILHTG